MEIKNNKSNANRFFLKVFIFILILAVFITVGCSLPQTIINKITKQAQQTQQVQIKNSALKELNSEISSLVEKITPSVVNIAVTINQQDSSGNQTLQQGVGAGIVFTKDGYILTNNHVAGDAVDIMVTLSDGTNYAAKLVGASADTDIAVIKIDANNLTPASFSSIDNQKVGDFVIAAGSPFGIQETITTGIISGKGRNIPISSDQLLVVDLIQTDASINPGNSGGPLINIEGNVIGINTLIFSPSGASAGIGFAIPSDTATNIANQIIKYGKPVIPFIGVNMDVNNTKIAGVFVKSVVADSPAEKAGVQANDILVGFSGKKITNPFDLLTQILRKNCGDTIPVKIYRNGNYLTINILLDQCPSPLKK